MIAVKDSSDKLKIYCRMYSFVRTVVAVSHAATFTYKNTFKSYLDEKMVTSRKLTFRVFI